MDIVDNYFDRNVCKISLTWIRKETPAYSAVSTKKEQTILLPESQVFIIPRFNKHAEFRNKNGDYINMMH